MKILLMRVVGTMLIALTLATISSAMANAHTALVESNPAEGAVVSTFPQRVELRFNEPLLTIGGEGTNFFILSSQTGERLKLGSFSVQGPLLGADVLEVPDASGEFRIEYRVVAGDGHVIRGDIYFSLATEVEVNEESYLQGNDDPAEERDSEASVLVLGILILMAASLMVGLLLRSGSNP